MPVSTMTDRQYQKHLRKRHIRGVMSKSEHDDNHHYFPNDYSHEHECSTH